MILRSYHDVTVKVTGVSHLKPELRQQHILRGELTNIVSVLDNGLHSIFI